MAMRKNKQRVCFLSKKDVSAGASGGAVDARLPEKAIIKRLANEPVRFEVASLVKQIRQAVVHWRLFREMERNRRSPAEVLRQAEDEARIVEEFMKRQEFRHPDIRFHVENAYERAGIDPDEVRVQLDFLLRRHLAALQLARESLATVPTTTGPKHSERRVALASVVSALRDHSQPKLSLAGAKALAEDLLMLCGVNR